MFKLIPIGKTAKLLGVSISTLRRWDQSGILTSNRKNKENRYYDLEAIEEFSENLNSFKLAKKWIFDKKGFRPLLHYYCPDSSTFRARNDRLGRELKKQGNQKSSIIHAITGEIGNNSFDHNLGSWSDIPGAFFSYNLKEREIVLADRGQGILRTLKKVDPMLKNHSDALETAFTRVISGRSPEHRGNGLKFARRNIIKHKMKLFFQTGNAQLRINKNSNRIEVKKSKTLLKGCLVKINY